jgi:hypothetical protein
MGKNISFGTVTVIVNVGAFPISLTGVIDREIILDFDRKKHDNECCDQCGEQPIFIGEHSGAERERFLILDVTAASLPTLGAGFALPGTLTLANLVGNDVAINEDYIVLIFPVEA